jgi:hypothetical protein
MKITSFKIGALMVLMIAMTLPIQAQRVKGNGKLIEKTRQVGEFESLGVSGSFDVYLKRGQEGKVVLSVEENLEPYLETEVEGGSLKIRWKRGANVRTTKSTAITVYFEELSGVALSGSGDIISQDRMVSDKMEIAVAGSGDIRLDLEVEEVSAAVSGSGDVELSGTGRHFEAAVAGSGDIKAYDLKSETAELKISGSGTIHASVEKEITARISGSGNIRYKGKPRIEDIKVSGSGNVSTY